MSVEARLSRMEVTNDVGFGNTVKLELHVPNGADWDWQEWEAIFNQASRGNIVLSLPVTEPVVAKGPPVPAPKKVERILGPDAGSW